MTMDWFSLGSAGLAFFVVAISPGPATISNSAIAMQYGRRTSFIYGLGLSSGLVFWGLLAASGMGAMLQNSLYLLSTLKVLGGLYLLWLALQSVRSARQQKSVPPSQPAEQRWFLKGLALNLSNPKSVIAWMAALSVGLDATASLPTLFAVTIVCSIAGFAANALYSLLFSIEAVMRGYIEFRRQFDGFVAALFTLAGFALIRSAFAH